MRISDPGFTAVLTGQARWSVCMAAALTLLLSGGVSTGWAVTLTWDGDTGTSGLQDGAGNWNTTDNNRWWNGSGYQVWSNATPDSAVFGNGGTGTALVTLTEPITVSGLRFKAGASYTITGSTLNITTITVTNDAGTEATISSTINGTRMNKNGAGRLILTTANPLTGGCCADFYDGPVQLANGSALGSNQIHVYNGALELVGGITVGNTLYLEHQGVGGTGGLRSISGDNIWSGPLYLHWQGGTPDAAIGVDAGSLTINGGIGTMTNNKTYPLTKVGAGKLIIKGASTYNDLTTVSAGVLNIQNAGALGITDAYTVNAGTTVASGAALELQHATGISVGAEALTISGSGIGGTGALRSVSGANSWGGPVTLTGSAYIGVDAGSLAINGSVNGSALTKVGAGTLTLGGANTYTGTTTVSAGLLNVTGSYTGAAAGSLFDLNGGSATFDMGAGSATFYGNGYGTSSRIADGGAYTSQLTVQSGTVSVLTQTGAGGSYGSLRLGSNNPSANGTIAVNGGALNVDGRILMAANAGTTSQATVTIAGGNLNLGIPGLYTTAGDPACGVLWFGAGTSTVNLNSGTLAMFGTINNGPAAGSSFNFNGGTLKAVGNNSNYLSLGANMPAVVKSGGAKIDTGGFNVSIAPALQHDAALGATPDGGLTKLGAGTLTLGGANTYTGTTTVSAGLLNVTGSYTGAAAGSLFDLNGGSATFDMGAGSATFYGNGYGTSSRIADGGAYTSQLTVQSGTVSVLTQTGAGGSYGSLRLGSNHPSANGTIAVNGGALNVDGRILMAANAGTTSQATVTIAGGNLNLGIPGFYTTAGDPACGVLWFGAGTSTVNLNSGTLSMFGTINNNPAAGSSFNFNGGTLKAVGNNSNYLSLGANMPAVVKSGGAKIDTGGFNVTVAPALQHDAALGATPDGGLTKLGAGTLTLDAANTYTGPTTISAGVLLVSNPSGSGTGSGAVNVNGGTLGGDGFIVTGDANVTVGVGGKLSPGMSPGTLTFNLGTGVLDISSVGSQGLLFELGAIGASDQVKLTSGTLSIGSGLDLDNFQLTAISGFQLGTYTLFDTPGTIAGSLGPNVWGTTGGYAAHLFFSPDGTDLQLEVVPEPSVLAMLLGLAGLGLAGYLRRRRLP